MSGLGGGRGVRLTVAAFTVAFLLALSVGPIGSNAESEDGRIVTEYRSVLSLIALGGSMTVTYVTVALLGVLAAAAGLLAWALRVRR